MEKSINYNFNKRQCVRALKRLGFVERSKRRKHFKFYPPENIAQKITPGLPQFIIVPNHRKIKVQKTYNPRIEKNGRRRIG